MEGNLILLNYDNEKCDTGVPLSEVKSLTITVVSGDEIARVEKTNGEKQEFDSATICGNWRCQGFYDGTYDVDMDKLEAWTNRKNSYDWEGAV